METPPGTPTGARTPPWLTEDEAAQDPAALCGRARLEARLARLDPAQAAAFRAAVRRCYGAAPED